MSDAWYVLTPGIKPADISQLTLALTYLQKSPTLLFYYGSISGSTIYVGSDLPTIAMPGSNQIMWNPTQGLQVISDQGVLGVQSPAMGLAHEISHKVFGYDEAQATAFETMVARELGEPTRADYNAIGSDVKVQNSTQHTDNGIWKTFEKGGGTKVGGTYDGSIKAPGMGTGFPVPPPNAPPGWGFASPFFSTDSNGNLHDASYLEYPPDNLQPGSNNFDTTILEFHLAQGDSVPVTASPMEHHDHEAHHVVAHIVGVHEAAHY